MYMQTTNTNNLCDLERTEELNNRIFNRNTPFVSLQPVFDIKSQSTKYVKLPIIDNNNDNTNNNINDIFSGNKNRWTEYSSNVNKESCLRNQIYPLNNSTVSHYVPDSKSDLYNNTINNNHHENQPFKDLFTQQTFNSFNPNVANLGQNILNNHTRQQLKDL